MGTFAPQFPVRDKVHLKEVENHISRCGGIGRRAGFKIQFSQESEGSIPSVGTLILMTEF